MAKIIVIVTNEDYFDELFLFFLYVCIMSGVQQNRRFKVSYLGAF
jgi:hypothetical protein